MKKSSNLKWRGGSGICYILAEVIQWHHFLLDPIIVPREETADRSQDYFDYFKSTVEFDQVNNYWSRDQLEDNLVYRRYPRSKYM